MDQVNIFLLSRVFLSIIPGYGKKMLSKGLKMGGVRIVPRRPTMVALH